jgi:hypothetical protein
MLALGAMTRGWSPPPNPRNVAAEPMIKIDGCLEQRQLCGSRPGLRLVALTAAPMAIGAAQRHVHRERAAMVPRGGVQRTASLPLHPRALRGLEAEHDLHLLPRDLPANCLEVDTRHGCCSLADGVVGCSRTVPFPFISIEGTGTIPWLGQSTRNRSRIHDNKSTDRVEPRSYFSDASIRPRRATTSLAASVDHTNVRNATVEQHASTDAVRGHRCHSSAFHLTARRTLSRTLINPTPTA